MAVFYYTMQFLTHVPNFRILTQVVAKKSSTEKTPYVLYKSDRRKTLAPIGTKKSVTESSIGEKEK